MIEKSSNPETNNLEQDFASQENQIRLKSKELLSSGTVDLVIGFCEGDEEGSPVPIFARSPDQSEKLVWTRDCWRNLSPYLKRFGGRIAIIAKPCDTRAIVNLIAENQLNRDNLFIIGVECGGMFNQDGIPAHGCMGCPSSVPAIHDFPVAADGGTEFIGIPCPTLTESASELADTDSVEGRRKRFLNEIDKCILCYSCRQACPGCYCESCFVDRKMTNWHQTDVDTGDKIAFHLTRAMHLAGRCVSCGACENVCASGVSLKYIYDEINQFIAEQYDFRAGVDVEARSAMNDYSSTDSDVGFLGGEGL